MLRRKSIITLLLTMICVCTFAMFKQDNNKVLAETYNIETSTGVTLNANDSVSFNKIANWSSKTIVFDIKTDGNKVQLQLRNANGGTGIIRTKPDRNPETANLSSVENVSGSPYWKATNTTPVSLGDGWYKWVVDLCDLKKGELATGKETIDTLKCLSGTNVQIKNLTVYDSYYYMTNNNTASLKNTISDWKNQTIQFEMNLSDNVTRRFVLREGSNNTTGLIVCSQTKLKVENPTGNPYLIEATTATPESLGNGWYKFKLALSELKIGDGDGTQTLDKIYAFSESSVTIELRNFKLVVQEYDPLKEEGVTTLTSCASTAITNIPNWGLSTISFDVYHGTLNETSEPQFIFQNEKGNIISSYFGYSKINNQTGLYLRTSKSTGYWVKASTQPTQLANDWYHWVIDLTELSSENGACGSETIAKIYSRESSDVYIKNLKVESVYDPSKEEGIMAVAGATEITSFDYWQYSSISFEVCQATLTTDEDPQFFFCEEGTTNNTSGFFGYGKLGDKTGIILRNPDSTGFYWALSSTQPEFIEKGWYRWTLNLSELGIGENSNGSETIGKLYNRRSRTVYIRNFTATTNPFVYIDKKEIILPYQENLVEKINASIIGSTGTIQFTSSNTNICTVNNRGEITFNNNNVTGTCEITASVVGNSEVKQAVCKINFVALKEYKTLNFDELSDGEQSLYLPAINSLEDDYTPYTYTPVSANNPSVVVRFLISVSSFEQSRQAVTIWGPESNGLSCYANNNNEIWSVCYKGALVFDFYGGSSNGNGLFVDKINSGALNSHNTNVKSMVANTNYYIEAGAIDLEEKINNVEYTYFFIKVNGVTVWTSLAVADSSFRNPVVAFTAAKKSVAKVEPVDLVDLTLVTNSESKIMQVANGLSLPELAEPVVDDAEKKFIGWKKQDGSIWNFDYDKVNGALTLTAEITSEFNTVIFNSNDGSLEAYSEKYIGTGMSVKAPKDEPSRDGYRFKYWSVSEDGLEFDFESAITEDTTLYAVWIKTYKVEFVYDNQKYLIAEYDENSYVKDPGWGYSDKTENGKWTRASIFALETLANGRAPYFSLTANGEKIDVTKIKVTEDKTIYVCFKNIETVKEDNEKNNVNSKWDYVSLKDLDNTKINTTKDNYILTEYSSTKGTYTPNKNNTTDSVIFRGKILLGDKFKENDTNIGCIALRVSGTEANNSINIWLRTREIYLRTQSNGPLYIANVEFKNVTGCDSYLDVVQSTKYLKTGVQIPIEFGILAVTTTGFEDYDRVYIKLGDVIILDIVIPQYGKTLQKLGATYTLGFFTDADTRAKSAFKIYETYDEYVVKFQDENGDQVASSQTVTKYQTITQPSYKPNGSSTGWYDKETNITWNFSKSKVTKETILIPAQLFKVTLDPNGGALNDGRREELWFDPSVQKVCGGCYVSFAAEPSLVDEDGNVTYKFIGWEKPDGSIWNKTDKVTSDITLKAKYQAYVTITYYIDDDTQKWGTKEVKKGIAIGEPKQGTPDSFDAYDTDEYEFMGWFIVDENGDWLEIDLDSFTPDKHIKVYARFSDGESIDPVDNKENTGCGNCASSLNINYIYPIFLLLGLIAIQYKKRENKE